jgi:hypothetical protein
MQVHAILRKVPTLPIRRDRSAQPDA